LDIEVAKEIRSAVGDDFSLLFDPAGIYTRQEALTVGRARLAECFGMQCQPNNWGAPLAHAVHFHCELAMPNSTWFEMTQPQGSTDRPYFKDRIRIDEEGYVPAPAKPGLGYEIRYDVLHDLTRTIER
jgi:L-alanine-DL-glutamate epimerase-like enolase superfamily enzyme